MSRRLIVLGSTGSIGCSTLDVVEHLRRHGHHFEVVGLAAGRNAELALQQATAHDVRHVALAEPGGLAPPDGVELIAGPNAALRLVESIARPGDMLVGAMVGAAGLAPTIAAIERGCDIALANKETLVAAGELVMPLAARHGVTLLPVDSEHSAIFQCLQAGRSPDEVRRIVITASGGPFRTWSADRMHGATVAEALNHPTWRMGRKVTIDSASMINKALEMIEAFWLFGIPAERIEAIIHPQSIVHSMVEFHDGSAIAQLSPPDMRMPIQVALTWPERVEGCARAVDWSTLSQLDFEPMDEAKFRPVALAREVMRRGGTAGAIFNAANEIAVDAFLAERIRFGAIAEIVADVLEATPSVPVTSVADVMDADDRARRAAATLVESRAAGRLASPSTGSTA